MLMTRFHVKKDERALLLRKGDFMKVLGAGEYALEKVTEKIDKISVFGGLEGVLKDLVKIRP
jgi:hypothetical protein